MPENDAPTTEPAATPAAPAPAAAAPTTLPRDFDPNADVDWDADLSDADWKVRARKWERDYKRTSTERQAEQQELEAFRNATKTDQQRLEDAANAARTELQTAKSEAARLRVAVKHQIAEEDFELLGEGTEEQLTARAERIVALRGVAAQPAVPKPNPAQGSSASGTPDLQTQLAAAQKAGDWTAYIALQNQMHGPART